MQITHSLYQAGLVTLLLDLLTSAEARSRDNVFDIELLASRLQAATEWLGGQPEARGRRMDYFGASTGAAAALWAAGEPGSPIGAIVSRGGRPDLAQPCLGVVKAPILPASGSCAICGPPR